jgi:SAM-dependent methyltransferase
MVERARQNTARDNLPIRFEIAGFGDLSSVFGEHSFDAVLCLGNSLPHLLSRPDLDEALADFARCLKPGGILLVQNRNFDAVMNKQERWMEPQSSFEEGTERIFQRFYDFEPSGLITFNMVILKRIDQGNWTQKVVSSHLRPLLKDELFSALARAGFNDPTAYGSMTGTPFDPQSSPNLVVTARVHA